MRSEALTGPFYAELDAVFKNANSWPSSYGQESVETSRNIHVSKLLLLGISGQPPWIFRNLEIPVK